MSQQWTCFTPGGTTALPEWGIVHILWGNDTFPGWVTETYWWVDLSWWLLLNPGVALSSPWNLSTLINSGANKSFIDQNLANQLQLQLLALPKSSQAHALDRNMLRWVNHQAPPLPHTQTCHYLMCSTCLFKSSPCSLSLSDCLLEPSYSSFFMFSVSFPPVYNQPCNYFEFCLNVVCIDCLIFATQCLNLLDYWNKEIVLWTLYFSLALPPSEFGFLSPE